MKLQQKIREHYGLDGEIIATEDDEDEQFELID